MRVRTLVGLLAGLALALLVAAPANAQAADVEANVHVINFGNFDATRGTYVMDFYLWFRWSPAEAPANFTPERFELINGRPTSRERILDETREDGIREVWFRIQANLYTDPDFRQYPFDRQRLILVFEDAVLQAHELQYRAGESSLNEFVRVPGYRIQETRFGVEDEPYPFGDVYSRVVFEIDVEREFLGTAVKTFLPLTVFAIVSGLSFLFPPEKLSLRVGAGTSMLISAVMFHVAQTASLPPLGLLTLIDKIMASLYSFLAGSLAVTALVSINADYWKRPDLYPKLTRYGFLATVSAPFVVFALLSMI
ncbi:MAG TPA: hypothetical protein VM681_07600 [Candidatus Thermoplasmatota archaeon]|nr:hypothetical protein [Candidatus Thermoplasmatota archaeon]